MSFPFLAVHVLRSCWALDPTVMAGYAQILANAYADRGDMRAAAAAPGASPKRKGSTMAGSVAVIPVHGVIAQRLSDLGPCDDGTGCETVGAALDAAISDPSVSQVLLSFNSPGGSVFGITELAAKIRGARAQKPVVGVADSMAASAAYWLLASCSEAYCTPGGMVGSIGVYLAHEDVSVAMKKAGVETTLVQAGQFKTEGHPFAPLSPEARAEMQKQCATYYGMFTGDVARGRGVPVDQVRTGMGQGRMLRSDDALKANMVDGVKTGAEVLALMRKGGRAAGPTRSSAAQQRRAGAAVRALIESMTL